MKLLLRSFLVVVAFTTATSLAAQSARVLLPITVDMAPGANGSVWMSDLWVDITTDAGVRIAPLQLTDFQPLGRRAMRLPIFYARPGGVPGQFITVTREQLPHVHFNLRVRDLSRQAETFGTEIPVVGEEEFRASVFSLLPLRLTGGFRTMVRVYGFEQSGGEVRVRVIGIEGDPRDNRELFATTLRLEATPSEFIPPYAEFPLHPIAVERDVTVRVLVEPLTPGARFWAFASTTHNETQHVTTISPQ